MMAAVFFVIVGLASFHFIYERIVAPSLRDMLKWRFEAIQYDLLRLRAEKPEKINHEVYKILRNSIANLSCLLEHVSLALFFNTEHEIRHNRQIKKRLDQRIALLESCTLPEVKIIQARIYKTFRLALLVNSGGLFIYVLPIIFVFVCMEAIQRFTKEIAVVPENEIIKIYPTLRTLPA